MKKLHLITIFLILAAVPAFSQIFNGGVFFGIDASQVDGDQWEGYHKAGILGGGLVSLRVSPHSSFQMEIGYIQKGSRKDSGSNHTYQLKLHYMEVPILYQYTLYKRFAVEIGPAMDILVGSKELSDGLEIDNPVPLRSVTFSGIIGGSAYISHHLKAGIRYNYSLHSIRNGLGYGYRKMLFEVGQYNNVISFSLYWDFKKNENF